MAKTKTAEPTAPPVKLFDIGTEFLELEAAMKASGGEWTDEMEQRFGSIEALEGAQAKKIDGYIALLKRSESNEEPLMAQAKWHEAQAKDLKGKAKTETNFRDRLQGRLMEHMRRLNVRDLPGTIWKVARHWNGGKRKVEIVAPAAELPGSFRRWVEPTEGYWVYDEDAIRAELVRHENYVEACQAEGTTLIAAGKLDGKARLEPQGEHIAIV